MNRLTSVVAASAALLLAAPHPGAFAAGISVGNTSVTIGTGGASVKTNLSSAGSAHAKASTGKNLSGATMTAGTSSVGGAKSRATVLNGSSLGTLCIGVGGGCGTADPKTKVKLPGGGSVGKVPKGSAALLAGMSGGDVAAYKKRCKTVLADPNAFESDLVQLCRLLGKL